MKIVMINAPILEQWSEDMDSAITPIIQLLGERMKHLDINAGTGEGGFGVETSDIAELEKEWGGQLSKVAARIDWMAVFARGIWFRY